MNRSPVVTGARDPSQCLHAYAACKQQANNARAGTLCVSSVIFKDSKANFVFSLEMERGEEERLGLCRHFSTAGRLRRFLDLKRVYEAPFLERAGRLPLGQASKREEAGLP